MAEYENEVPEVPPVLHALVPVGMVRITNEGIIPLTTEGAPIPLEAWVPERWHQIPRSMQPLPEDIGEMGDPTLDAKRAAYWNDRWHRNMVHDVKLYRSITRRLDLIQFVALATIVASAFGLILIVVGVLFPEPGVNLHGHGVEYVYEWSATIGW